LFDAFLQREQRTISASAHEGHENLTNGSDAIMFELQLVQTSFVKISPECLLKFLPKPSILEKEGICRLFREVYIIAKIYK